MQIKTRDLNLLANKNLIGLWFSILFAGLQFRIITFVLKENFELSLKAAEGVLNGYPHWRVYQNRLLGPLIFQAGKYIFKDSLFAYILISILLISIAGFIVWKIGDSKGGLRLAFSILCVFHILFTFTLNLYWLYLWDYISLVIFLLFVESVISKRSILWFLGIWFVGIFNHENAVFIGTYLIADSLVPLIINRINNINSEFINFDVKKIFIGFSCVTLSTLIVEFLRNTFLKEAIAPSVFGLNIDPNIMPFQLFKNFKILKSTTSTIDYYSTQTLPIIFFLLTIVLITILIFLKNPILYGGFSLNYLLFIASLLMFGVFYETRIYINLIPLCILGAIVLTDRKVQ